jgi:flagellar basal body-associated protein FliL
MGGNGPVLKMAVPPADDKDGGLNIILIVGIVAAIVAVALAGYILLRRR